MTLEFEHKIHAFIRHVYCMVEIKSYFDKVVLFSPELRSQGGSQTTPPYLEIHHINYTHDWRTSSGNIQQHINVK